MKLVFRICFLLGLLALTGCRHPDVEYVDFDTFHVLSVKSAPIFMADGSLNPEIRMMEEDEPETKVAATNQYSIIRNLLGEINCNNLIHISGTYSGHDVDGSPLTLSGKLLLPKDGPVKNIMIVSHFTVASNAEAPSESFPMEGIWAAKGYAMVFPDYIGFGVSSGHIHPYMHAESTARSALDMALAVQPYLKHIGREPENEAVILAGFSQGAANTLALMEMIQDGYESVLPIKKVYAGSGPYDLVTTCDLVLERERSNLPCAIPMLVQGFAAAENPDLKMTDFFQPEILAHYDEWINSKLYTVREINAMIGTHDLKEIMTEKGRDKNGQPMSMLYQSLQRNSLLRFTPRAPLYLFHSHQDQMVPFVNALKAQEYFKDNPLVQCDFGDYSLHGISCCYFLLKVFKDL